MCGIAGIFNISNTNPPEHRILEKMIYPVTHRGPDGYGFYKDEHTGLAHARLSIIDLEGGWQPIHNEDKTLWIVFNGEIFNYPELRSELKKLGHRFYTDSDTEVIIHLYEEKKEKCLDGLNGQFAMAIYDSKEKSLFLARDRMGIRPLYYSFYNGSFYFASEVKSLFAGNPSMYREINPEVLYEIFNFWTPSANETIFKGIRQLSPGHWLKADKHGVSSEKEYWDIPFLSDYTNTPYSEDEFGDMLHELLKEATLLRLRADVPVGAYLSGGLDSSSITSLISLYSDNSLKTFSVTFTDEVYNEQKEQKQMVEFLKTDHHAVSCSYDTIAAVFPDVIWHTETPVLRTAPAPLYLLSALVRENNYKVVLTGEGADEILGGYDIFKEAKIRAFIRKNPESPMRALLLKRLYPHFALSPVKSVDYAKKIFNTEAYAESDIFYAHRPRWQVTKGTNIFLSKDITSSYKDPVEKLTDRFAAKLKGLDYFSQAQYLESKLLLANYLLSSQGDRMAMSHSVEGRFPFLDHRVVELACKMPPNYKMKVLNEKNILKKSMKNFLPKSILKRTKQPYMAPDILSFFKGDNPPEYLDYYLSESLIKEAGLFRPDAVRMLINKCRKKMRQGFRDNMAFTGILSAQILYDKFIKDFQVKTPQSLNNVRILS